MNTVISLKTKTLFKTVFSILIIRLSVKAGSTNTTLDLDLWVGGKHTEKSAWRRATAIWSKKKKEEEERSNKNKIK